MFNPLHIPVYQANFWNKTSLGDKALVFTYSIAGAVAFRALSAMKNNASFPWTPKNFTPWEAAGTTAFLVYLVGSTFMGYLKTPKQS